MAKITPAVLNFNKGLISRLALSRVDVKRVAFSAETYINWMPRVLGSMMIRPGLAYLGATSINEQARFLRFVFSTNDTALVEITQQNVRVWVADVLVNRPAVSSTVVNGDFNGSLASWTDADEGTAVSQWAAGNLMELIGDGSGAAIRYGLVTVVAGDIGVEHGIKIVIDRGPVTLRVGSTIGGDEYISETALGTGQHSLAITPTGNFYIQFMSRLVRVVRVAFCIIEPAGPMSVTNNPPWFLEDIRKISYDQSGDILFITCAGTAPYKIERRAPHSWSLVKYEPEDGPFRSENVGPITITPNILTGNGTLTASKALFKASQVGGLMRVTSAGQTVSAAISAANTFTNPIRVTGTLGYRLFWISVAGTFVADVTLQRSIGAPGTWTDVKSYSTPTQDSLVDGLDNQIIYYRIGVKAGAYTSGTVTCVLGYALGSITGVARITEFTSETVVNIEILKDFGDVVATALWAEGSWSQRRGYPSSCAFYEGRLWFAGKNGIWGSITDAYDGFDPDFVGDAGTINRTIGSGPVDSINWILPMQRLLVGAEGAEFSVRSTTFDEPLTPTNFNIKEASTQGSAPVPPCKIDSRGIFVQRSAARVYELSYDFQVNDYQAKDLTALVPELGSPGIVAIAVQRQPDTRIHCVKSDGTAMVGVIDRVEDVLGWVEVHTDGDIEDVVVLPGAVTTDTSNHAVGSVLSLAVRPGSGYTTQPTLTFDSGTAAATCDLQVVSGSGNTVGTGYVVGDVLTVLGGTRNQAATFRITYAPNVPGVGVGVALGWEVVSGGDYTVIPANPVSFSGGSGTALKLDLVWGIGPAFITDPGDSYLAAPNITVVGGGGGFGGAVTATIGGGFLTGSSSPTEEDSVYYCVRRVIDGAVVRYLEKWAIESSARGGIINNMADSYVTYQSETAERTISGLTHLEGKPVIVWGDGVDLSPDNDDGSQRTYVVSNGSITLDVAVSNAIIGLPYDAQWKSTKLAHADPSGGSLTQRKRVTKLGLVMADVHPKGIKFGPDFTTMDDLPEVEAGAIIDANEMREAYDYDLSSFPGGWDTDSRICLRGRAPRPCTILAAVIAMEENKNE